MIVHTHLDILQSGHLRKKADILEKALFGKITPQIPASILQFYQGELTVVCDTEAFSTIKANHPDFS